MDRGDLNGTHEGSGAGNEEFAKSLRDGFKGDNRPKVRIPPEKLKEMYMIILCAQSIYLFV